MIVFVVVTPAPFPTLLPGQSAVASKWECDTTAVSNSCSVTEWQVNPANTPLVIANPLPVKEVSPVINSGRAENVLLPTIQESTDRTAQALVGGMALVLFSLGFIVAIKFRGNRR